MKCLQSLHLVSCENGDVDVDEDEDESDGETEDEDDAGEAGNICCEAMIRFCRKDLKIPPAPEVPAMKLDGSHLGKYHCKFLFY